MLTFLISIMYQFIISDPLIFFKEDPFQIFKQKQENKTPFKLTLLIFYE